MRPLTESSAGATFAITGATFDAAPLDPAKVTGMPVGIGTFVFAVGNNFAGKVSQR